MAVKKKTEVINWTYLGKEIDGISKTPPLAIGFVYKITNLKTNKYYYGRKTIRSLRKKKLTVKEKLLPENKRKTFKYEETETSGWKKYRGSSKPLLAELDLGDKYTKEIIEYAFSKAQLTYLESSIILCSGALLTEDSYNSWMSCKVYKTHLMAKEK